MEKISDHLSIDRADVRILTALLEDARATLADLSEASHLSISQAQRRLRKLEQLGVIMCYQPRINPSAIGLGISAYVEITLKNQETDFAERFHAAIQQVPEVIECHRVSGEADYLAKVYAPDLKTYSKLAQTSILAIPEVDRLTSKIVFESPKEAAALPLDYALAKKQS